MVPHTECRQFKQSLKMYHYYCVRNKKLSTIKRCRNTTKYKLNRRGAENEVNV